MKIKVGDLIRAVHREDEDELCLVIRVHKDKMATVKRSRKRSYEKSKIVVINTKYNYEYIQ